MSEVREPAPGEWPEVRTDGPVPEPDAVPVEQGTALVQPPQVVAHGLVTGIPWKIQAWTTAPAPGAKWWEGTEAVGPEMEFQLGAHGFAGGGGIHVRVAGGHAFTASGHFFGRVPHVIAWTGVVRDDVNRLEVRLEDGRSREVGLHAALDGMPRFFWFFPPRGVSAALVALDRDGRVLEGARLPEADVPGDANAGTAVNPPGWPADRPPPGWPEEDRDFAPGEGPRREEDFLLHIAHFPILVLPPEAWQGLAFLSGHGGHGDAGRYVPTQIAFEYLDRVSSPTRGLRVVSVEPATEEYLEKLYPPHREEGVWWFDSGHDAAYLPQLHGRFRDGALTRSDPGPATPQGRRYRGRGRLTVAGTQTAFERWEYQAYPELVEIRFRLPDVAIRVEGWSLQVEEVFGTAARLERLELGSELLRRLTQANDAANRAWDSWTGGS